MNGSIENGRICKLRCTNEVSGWGHVEIGCGGGLGGGMVMASVDKSQGCRDRHIDHHTE